MVVVERWTGERACLLQAALRHTNESFARSLGLGVRTVATWHAEPALVPRADVQAILDTALERASAAVVQRFEASLWGPLTYKPPAVAPTGPRVLTVAVAVVRREDSVLLVCRRAEEGSALRWQFPSGIVKPGSQPSAVALSETLGETGIHAAVIEDLGSRVHPVTGVVCRYLLCDYLAGEARNADTLENLAVEWVPVANLARFIPLPDIFPPILDALEYTHD